ncbi:hypothetical protein D3C79_1073600 [compost metagenome]
MKPLFRSPALALLLALVPLSFAQADNIIRVTVHGTLYNVDYSAQANFTLPYDKHSQHYALIGSTSGRAVAFQRDGQTPVTSIEL